MSAGGGSREMRLSALVLLNTLLALALLEAVHLRSGWPGTGWLWLLPPLVLAAAGLRYRRRLAPAGPEGWLLVPALALAAVLLWGASAPEAPLAGGWAGLLLPPGLFGTWWFCGLWAWTVLAAAAGLLRAGRGEAAPRRLGSYLCCAGLLLILAAAAASLTGRRSLLVLALDRPEERTSPPLRLLALDEEAATGRLAVAGRREELLLAPGRPARVDGWRLLYVGPAGSGEKRGLLVQCTRDPGWPLAATAMALGIPGLALFLLPGLRAGAEERDDA